MVRSGCTRTRPARSSGAPSVAPSGEAATPAAHSTVAASIAPSPISTRPGATLGHRRVRCGPRRRGARGRCRADVAQRLRERRRAPPGPPSSSRMRAELGSKWRKSRASDCRAISASAPASSTPVGPPPTTTNVSSACASRGSGLALGPLERQQHAAPDLQRILERLQPRRDAAATRHGRSRRASPRRRRSGSRTRASPSASCTLLGGGVDRAATSASSTSTFGWRAQDPPDRRGDVTRRERRAWRPDRAAAGTHDGCGDPRG